MPEPYLHERLWVYRGTELDPAPAAAQETYEYDAAGRLVAIEESRDLWHLYVDGERLNPGGRRELEYDGEGLKRIPDVYERLDEPFEDFLRRGAAAYEQAIVDALGQEVQPGTEAFALVVVYVAQGSLHPVIELGTERSEDPLDMLYPETLGYPDVEDDEELDWRLLSQAALHQPGDPYRLVHGEVCRRLARRDWGGLIVPAEDFVVFCAEHDEGTDEKEEMIRAVNPPERVKHWEKVFRLASEY